MAGKPNVRGYFGNYGGNQSEQGIAIARLVAV